MHRRNSLPAAVKEIAFWDVLWADPFFHGGKAETQDLSAIYKPCIRDAFYALYSMRLAVIMKPVAIYSFIRQNPNQNSE
jgi:hypothetical protein